MARYPSLQNEITLCCRAKEFQMELINQSLIVLEVLQGLS